MGRAWPRSSPRAELSANPHARALRAHRRLPHADRGAPRETRASRVTFATGRSAVDRKGGAATEGMLSMSLGKGPDRTATRRATRLIASWLLAVAPVLATVT